MASVENWIPGDRKDFERLYLASYPKIVASLRIMLRDPFAAEDCAQDTFRQAWRAWPRWKPEAPPEAWLHRIAVRVASNYRTREKLRSAGELVRRLGRPGVAPDPAEAVGASDLRAALQRLPAKQAAVIALRHLHGYSNRELAVALNIPERTVASRLIAARKRLIRELGPDFSPQMSTSPDSAVLNTKWLTENSTTNNSLAGSTTSSPPWPQPSPSKPPR